MHSQMYTVITLACCWVLYSLKATFAACSEAESANGYQEDCPSVMCSSSVQTKNLALNSLCDSWMLLLLAGNPQHQSFRPHLHFPCCRANQALPSRSA